MAVVAGFIGGMFSFGAGAAFAAGGAAFGGWVAGAAFGSTILGGIAAKLLASVAISALTQALAPDPGQGGGITITHTARGEHQPETIMLGKYATAGQAISPPYSHGKSNAYLTHIIEVCSAPGAQLERVMIGDDWVELGSTPHPDYGRPVLGDYQNLVWVKYYDGTQTAADPMLLDRYGSHPDRPWTADMVGAGICYAILTFQYDQENQPSVPRYRFELSGIPLYDRRRDGSAGGVGPQRLGDQSTWEPTENPAVIAWNVMRGIPLPGGEVWGGNITDLSELPWAVWLAAMNRCDVPVSNAGGGTEPTYRAALEVALDQPPAAALEEIFKASSATVADLGYGWGIVVGAPALPVYSFSDDDIIVSRPQELDPFPGIEETYNAVTARYPDPEALYETKEAPRRTNAAFEIADAFGRRMANLALPAAPYKRQVQRLTRAWLEDARRFRRHVICLPPDAAHVELIDTVDWSSVRNGYSGKDFSVHEITEDPRTGIRQLSLRERDPSDYSWLPEFELPSTPTTPGSTPAAPEPVSGFDAEAVILTDADGIRSRVAIRMFWDADILAEGLRWQIRRAGQTEAALLGSTQAVDAGMHTVADGILPVTTYQVRMRLIARRRTVWSDWITVSTPDVRITREELEEAVLADLDALEDWITDGVDELTEDLLALAQAIEAEAIARANAAAQLAQDLAAEAQARADAIAAEQQARLAEVREIAANWRQTRDRVSAIVAEVIELANADHLAREEIRRSIALQIGDLRASYDERISTIVGDNLAAVQRIETLEATSGNLTAEVQRIDQARIDGEEALALSIASLAVGTDNQFDAAHIWHFDASVEGWTGGSWQAGGWLQTTGQITSPAGLDLAASRYSQIRLRLRRSGSVTWAGYAWWAGAGQAWDSARRIEIPEPTWTEDVGLITVTMPWTGAVDRVRLEFGTGTLDLDWIALGRPAPGASSADLDNLRQVMSSADDALAEDVTQLDTRITGAEGALDAQAGAIDGIETRVTTAEGTIASQGTAITVLEGRVTNTETQTEANADAIDALQTYVESGGDGSQVVAAEAIRALRSAIRRLAAEGAEGAARDHLATRQVREYVAEASQSLNTRIDLTDEQVRIVAEAVTLLQAAMPGLASAQALQSLIATVTEQGDLLTAHGLAITDIEAELDGKASATALQQLGATVSDQGDLLTAQGQAITTLQVGLADKAAASAVQALETTVGQQGAELSAQGQAITTIEADLGDLAAALAGKASVSAVQALTGRVDATEQQIDSHSELITNLRNDVDGKASASALSALQSVVSAQAGQISSQGSSITTLNNSLSNTITLAEGKGRVFVQDGAPPVAQRLPQNLWIDTTGGNNIPKRWNGSAWVAVRDKAATDALALVANKADASALQALSNTVSEQGNVISSQGSAITTLQNTINHPSSGLGSKASSSALSALTSRVTATETVANSKSRVYRQATAPANPSPSDIWFDTSSKNKAWRWSGSQWTTIEDGDIPLLKTDVSAQANLITALEANVGRMRAGGRFRVTTAATPTGADARIGLHAEASDGQTTHSAGLFLVAESNGATSVTVMADRFAVVTGSGPDATRRVPFAVRGGDVYLQNAIVDTLAIGPNQVTVPVYAEGPNVQTRNNDTWRDLVSLSMATEANVPTLLHFSMQFSGYSPIQYRIIRDGTVIMSHMSDGVFNNPSTADLLSGMAFDPNKPPGTVTYRLQVRWGGVGIVAKGKLLALGVKR